MNIRKIPGYLALSVLLWAGGVVGHVSAERPESVNWAALTSMDAVPGELLVGYNSEISSSTITVQMQGLHAAVGAQVVDTFRSIPVQHVRLSSSISPEQAAQHYLSDPRVAFVEPNYIVRPLATTPNDPQFGDLWGMSRIRAPEAWDFIQGDSSIIVAVIDTGIQIDHPDLKANIWKNMGESWNLDGTPNVNGIDTDGNGYVDDHYGWNFAANTRIVNDTHGHGTHCAGTVGAVGDNGVGVVGVNWNVQLMALKFLDPYGETADAIKAVEYAAAMGAKLSNNSWGGGAYSEALKLAIQAAGVDHDHLFIAAAGNDSTNNDDFPHYPSNYELSNVVSVASIAEDGNRSYFSNYGSNTVHLAAPGSLILSTVPVSTYDRYSGTSMACPHVAGAAALLWSLDPSFTSTQIRDALFEGVRPNVNMAAQLVTGGELDLMGSIEKLGGFVMLDRKAYRSDATVEVAAVDHSLSPAVTNVYVDVEVRDPLDVVRWSDSIELGWDTNTAHFTGSFMLLSGTTAVEGDTMRVSYTDGYSRVIVVTTPIDDTPPVLSLWSLSDETDQSVKLSWMTDEPGDSFALSGATLPLNPTGEQGSAAFVEVQTVVNGSTGYWHEVTVTGLTGEAGYFFAVLSADHAGNRASLPSNLLSVDPEDYLRLITLMRRTMYTQDWEKGILGWSVTNAYNNAACWQLGMPWSGPGATFSGSNTWGTILNGPYPSLANASLTSPMFHLGERPSLEVQHWYQMQETYDRGYVEANRGHGWEMVGFFSGASVGWTQSRIELPSSFSHQSVRFRFRFESDYAMQFAGWYIDDLAISELSPRGVYLSHYDMDDAAPGGNNDGAVQVGETFTLNLELFNNLYLNASNVQGHLETSVAGITLDGGPFRVIDYGVMPSGDSVLRDVEVSVSGAYIPGTPIPFQLILTADGLDPWYEEFTLEPSTNAAAEATLQVRASQGVVDWLGRRLPGNGGPNASLFQVIYAGADGLPDAPTVDGKTSGDDQVLSLIPERMPFGRMGVGQEKTPDMGRLNQWVDVDGLPLHAQIYIRAWDDSRFSAAVAYGDSSLYSLALVTNELFDALGWVVDQVPEYPGLNAKDYNGDGIPDGWHVQFGYDPRLPLGPLAPTSSVEQTLGTSGSGLNQFNQPRKMFLSDTNLFVLDTKNHRITIWKRATGTAQAAYGSFGGAVGQFRSPGGMAHHPTLNRFAVADTDNNRVQVFEFDPSTGAISNVLVFGSAGSGTGQFNKPSGIAIDSLGNIVVADTKNHRIQRFGSTGSYLGQFGTLGTLAGNLNEPADVAVDSNGVVYVADRGNHRLQGFDSLGTALWTLGGAGSGPGQFSLPNGVELGVFGRIFVADTSNNRVQIFDADRNHQLSFGQMGSGAGDLHFPYGVAPVPDASQVYVVDTWNNRIQWFDTIIDSDGDGMDDVWEWQHFGSLAQGALDDFDGDGLPNIAEYRIGTDPTEGDTDGDGVSDSEETNQNSDPTDSESYPPFSFEIISTGGAPYVALSWLASTGEVFSVETTTNLLSGAWLLLPGSTFTSTIDGVVGYTNLLYGGESLLFYRPVRWDP